MKKTRKAFTLVELLVVIAILAVLATVGIVGYTSFTKKAKESNDRTVISQLNLALQASETTDGKPKTMYEALKVVEGAGFVVANLTPDSDGYDYVYDMKNNRFALLNGDTVVAQATDKAFVDGVTAWQFADKVENMSTKRSNYLKDGFTGPVTTSTGLDCGNNTGITSVSYSHSGDAQEVVIRTNGGNLTVNAPSDTVNHYGVSDTVNVIAIASASFHENGKVVEKITVSSGHVVVENKAVVPQIIVSQATDSVKVTANAETTVFVDAASSSNTSIVANSENVYVAGVNEEKISGNQSTNVKKSVSVSSETELRDALAAKESFIQLSASFDIENYVVLIYDLTLDLNGFNVTAKPSAPYNFVFSDNKAVLTDSVGTGKVTGKIPVWTQLSTSLTINGGTYVGSSYAVRPFTGSSVTINGGTFESPENQAIGIQSASVTFNNGTVQNAVWGITVFGNGNSGSASLIVNGGKISGTTMAVSGNGSAGNAGTVIEIHGGEFTTSSETGTCIYHPQNGSLKIDGAPVIKGPTALYIKSGMSTIKGGKFITTLANKAAYNFNGNGANGTGDAIVIDACNYPGGNPLVEIEISGASFQLADSSAKKVAYYSHENGAAVVTVDGETLEPIVG